MVRCRRSSVSGFPRLCLNIRIPCASSCLAPPPTGRADFPHPAVPSTLGSWHARGVIRSELNYAQTVVDKMIPAHILRWLKGALTPTLQVAPQSLLHELIDRPKRLAGIARTEVV